MSNRLRYLRKPQFEAIETYLYLRFVKQTPHITDLYKDYYQDLNDRLEALGINLSPKDLLDIFANGEIDDLFEKNKNQ